MALMGLTAGNVNSGTDSGESQTGGVQTQTTPHYRRCEKSEYCTGYRINCEPGTCIPEEEMYEVPTLINE